jgi:hypothetical protein
MSYLCCIAAVMAIFLNSVACKPKKESVNNRTRRSTASDAEFTKNAVDPSSQSKTGKGKSRSNKEALDTADKPLTDKTFFAVYGIGSDLEDVTFNGTRGSEEPFDPFSPEEGALSDDFREMLEGYNSLNAAQKSKIGGLFAYGGSLKPGMNGFRVASLACLNEDNDDDVFGNAGCTDIVEPKTGMADTKTLMRFLTLAKQEATKMNAGRTFVVLWNHGAAHSGFGNVLDSFKTGGQDLLSIDNIAQAFAESGFKPDILGFDACLMGSLEVLHKVKNAASYVLASAEAAPVFGWSYREVFRAAAVEPLEPAPSLAQVVIDNYIDGVSIFYSGGRQFNLNHGGQDGKILALYDLEQVDRVTTAIDSFANFVDSKIGDSFYEPSVNSLRDALHFTDHDGSQTMVAREFFEGLKSIDTTKFFKSESVAEALTSDWHAVLDEVTDALYNIEVSWSAEEKFGDLMSTLGILDPLSFYALDPQVEDVSEAPSVDERTARLALDPSQAAEFYRENKFLTPVWQKFVANYGTIAETIGFPLLNEVYSKCDGPESTPNCINWTLQNSPAISSVAFEVRASVASGTEVYGDLGLAAPNEESDAYTPPKWPGKWLAFCEDQCSGSGAFTYIPVRIKAGMEKLNADSDRIYFTKVRTTTDLADTPGDQFVEEWFLEITVDPSGQIVSVSKTEEVISYRKNRKDKIKKRTKLVPRRKTRGLFAEGETIAFADPSWRTEPPYSKPISLKKWGVVGYKPLSIAAGSGQGRFIIYDMFGRKDVGKLHPYSAQ